MKYVHYIWAKNITIIAGVFLLILCIADIISNGATMGFWNLVGRLIEVCLISCFGVQITAKFDELAEKAWQKYFKQIEKEVEKKYNL